MYTIRLAPLWAAYARQAMQAVNLTLEAELFYSRANGLNDDCRALASGALLHNADGDRLDYSLNYIFI